VKKLRSQAVRDKWRTHWASHWLQATR